MSERHCAKCSKKLRSNCVGDTCWSCRKGTGTAPRAPAPVRALKPVKVKGDAISRFKAVAAALGFDGGGMLEEYAQAWLDVLRSKAEAIASSASLGLAALDRPQLAPVRLRPGRLAEERTPSVDPGVGA